MNQAVDAIKAKFDEFGFNSFDKTSSDVASLIINFESSNGYTLHPEYKYYLGNYGEGNFENDVVYKPVKKNPLMGGEGTQEISFFYGVGTSNNISKILSRYANRMPKGYVPIAELPGGNQLCIDTKRDSSNYGKIYLWDHENECDGGFENIYLVANSFSDFICSFEVDSKKEEYSVASSRLDF